MLTHDHDPIDMEDFQGNVIKVIKEGPMIYTHCKFRFDRILFRIDRGFDLDYVINRQTFCSSKSQFHM